jgi:hypothetical protein
MDILSSLMKEKSYPTCSGKINIIKYPVLALWFFGAYEFHKIVLKFYMNQFIFSQEKPET